MSVRGAETRLGPHGFDNVAVGAGDVAIFSGYTLIHRSAEALSAFMRRTAGHDFPAVFDTSPVIGQITDAQLDELVSYRTLIHRSAEALSAFMRRTAGHDFPAVFDTSPVIGQITDAQLDELVSYRSIWTCNEREGGILAERLGLGGTPLTTT